jgi:hypothetical protein
MGVVPLAQGSELLEHGGVLLLEGLERILRVQELDDFRNLGGVDFLRVLRLHGVS